MKPRKNILGFQILRLKYIKKILLGFSTHFHISMIFKILIFEILKFNCTLLFENTKCDCKSSLLLQIFWAIGACFEVLLALVVMPTLGWQWLLGFSALPLLLFSICCFVSESNFLEQSYYQILWCLIRLLSSLNDSLKKSSVLSFDQWLPESARYDITRGNVEKAVATLQRIAEENGKPMLPGRLVEPSNKVRVFDFMHVRQLRNIVHVI